MDNRNEISKLNAEYKKLMGEAHKLMSKDRRASDAKIYDANMILEKIKQLEKDS